MLSDRCLSVCPVCDLGVLWPKSWMDQDETWHGGRPQPGHVVLDGDAAPPPPSKKGHSPPIIGPCMLWPWPNGRLSQLMSSCLFYSACCC